MRSLRGFIQSGIIFTAGYIFAGGFLGVYAQQPDKYAPYDKGIPKGYKIIEGDILVPIVPPAKGIYDTNLWPLGIVPYEFDANVNATNQNRMLAAMAEWEAVADVEFIPRLTGHVIYIHIQDSTINSSVVGMVYAGQVVNIASWGTRFIIVHELGHTLGLWHEQSRYDRDTYVIIEWDRIEDDEEHNFEMHATEGVYGPYDFDSVMHYGQCSFSTCADCGADLPNCRTITVKPPWDTNWQNNIGQRNHLSEMDQYTIQMLYPENDWVFVDKSYVGVIETGTFFMPYKQFNSGTSAVSSGGTVVIQPGSYNETGSYSKRMTWWAPLGGVAVGQ